MFNQYFVNLADINQYLTDTEKWILRKVSATLVTYWLSISLYWLYQLKILFYWNFHLIDFYKYYLY